MVTSPDALSALALSFAGGVAIGAGFCALLWLNLQGLSRRARPRATLLLGGALRVTVVLGGLWLLTGWRAMEVLAALAGFAVARALAAAVARAPRRPAPAGTDGGGP